jgi:hypothetical protein
MAKSRTQGNVLHRWERMIESCEQNAGRLPGMEPFVVALREWVDEVKAIKGQQDQQAGLRRSSSQALDHAFDRGQEAERQLRGFILSHFDSRDAQLAQFFITPNGKRPRRPEPVPSPEPPPVVELAKPGDEPAAAPDSPDSANLTANPPAAAKAAE